jgi:uracil-DNA glycosylase
MRNANCKLCGLYAGARTVCVPGDGPKDADILIVGQNPGQQEDREGRPFVGPSGKILKAQLAKAELGTLFGPKVRYTNVVRCLTPDNREPTAKEIKACKPYLDAEIKLIAPKYIVPLGALATKAIAKAKVTTAHGQMIPQEDRIVCATYHPAATFRDPSKLQVIQQDFARLKRQIDGTLGATQDAFKYRVVTDRSILKEFFEAFDAADEYAYDTETNGLFLKKPDFKIRSIAFALPECSWVIPLEMPGGYYRGDYNAQAALFRVLARKAQNKWAAVFHGKYDSAAVRRAYDVSLPYHFDAMLAHYLLDENQDHDLKYVARIELDCPEYDLDKKLKISDDEEKWLPLIQVPENREKYWEYNARDAWNTLHLAYKFADKFRRNASLRRLFNALIIPSSYALETIEAEGLPVDHAQYMRMETETLFARNTAERTLNKAVEALRESEATVNWNSPQQIAKVLYEDVGLLIQQRTPMGAPSTSESAIVDLKGKHPIINELLHFRKLDKILGTYLQGWKQYIVNDRIYFSYKQHGTTTGRYASRLHQIPTDADIRSIIATGANSDWEFVAADLSQAELRIAAEMSGDTSLISLYRGGQDVHWNTLLFLIGAGHMDEYAKQALDTARAVRKRRGNDAVTSLSTALDTLRHVGVEACVAYWKGWKDARTNAKRCAFGFLYGMYEKKFCENMKVDYDWYCTFAQAHAFRTGFFEVYSGLEPWHNRCKRIARIDGYVTNMFGRVRRLPAIQSTDKLARMEAERQAVNCVTMDTECLSENGWVSGGTLCKGDRIYSLNPATNKLELVEVEAVSSGDYQGPLYEWRSQNFFAATTADHRWLIRKRKGRKRRIEYAWCTSRELATGPDQQIPLCAPAAATDWGNITDDELRLLGWSITDGHYPRGGVSNKTGKRWNISSVLLFQRKLHYVEEIDALLQRLKIPATKVEHSRHVGYFTWYLLKDAGEKLRKLTEDGYLSLSTLTRLSARQCSILLETVVKGDGWREGSHTSIACGADKRHVDLISALGVLAGHAVSVRTIRPAQNHKVYLSIGYRIRSKENYVVCVKQRKVAHPQYGKKIHLNWRGKVWCPTVKHGNFLARKNGSTFITGNSPVQGTIGDWKAAAMVEINETIDREQFKLCGEHHDALLGLVRRGCEDDVLPRVRRIIERPKLLKTFKIRMQVPMRTDVSIGPWGKGKVYHDPVRQ